MDHISLGSSPVSEDCAQIGTPGYAVQADLECRAYISQLKRMSVAWMNVHHPDHPFVHPGFSLKVRSQPHDFGDYFEVFCFFDPECKPAVDLAYYLEANLPEEWDERSKVTLGITT